MSHSTISSEFVATESIRSSIVSIVLPYLAPVIDSDSKPFEALASLVASDSDSVEPSFNSESLSDRVSPVISVASDPDDEPLGSPDTVNYYRGLMRFLALRWHLEGMHVTWGYLEKKRTRLRTYTKSLKKYCLQNVDTALQA
nr:hypothetical protein [Tanacetum cinerariifolium]